MKNKVSIEEIKYEVERIEMEHQSMDEVKPEFLEDENFVRELCYRMGSHYLKYVSTKMLENRDLMLDVIDCNGYGYQYIGESLLNDVEIYEVAAEQWSLAIAYAGPKIKDDKKLVQQAVEKDPQVFGYISKRLQKDIDIILLAFARKDACDRLDLIEKNVDVVENESVIKKIVYWNEKLFEKLPQDYRNKKSIWEDTIKNTNERKMLRSAGDKIKNNKLIVLECLRKNINTYEYIGEKLKIDVDVWEQIIEINNVMLNRMPVELKDNKKLGMIALNKLKNDEVFLMSGFSSKIFDDIEMIKIALKNNKSNFLQNISDDFLKKDENVITLVDLISENGINLLVNLNLIDRIKKNNATIMEIKEKIEKDSNQNTLQSMAAYLVKKDMVSEIEVSKIRQKRLKF